MDKKEQVQLYSNETVIELVRALKKKVQSAERLTIIALMFMLLQTTFLVGGVLYFLSTFNVEMTTETIEQSVEGDNGCINNIKGDGNTISQGGN